MQLQEKDIVGFAIDRASAILTYWNIFIAVATAIVGIMASGKGFTSSKRLKWFLTFAFVVFAVSNLDAIVRLGELRTSFLLMLDAANDTERTLIASLQPAPSWQYVLYRVTLDAVVIGAIWLVRWPAAETKAGEDLSCQDK